MGVLSDVWSHKLRSTGVDSNVLSLIQQLEHKMIILSKHSMQTSVLFGPWLADAAAAANAASDAAAVAAAVWEALGF